jgi:hypothetical protein
VFFNFYSVKNNKTEKTSSTIELQKNEHKFKSFSFLVPFLHILILP